MIHVYWIEPTLNPSSISVDSSPKKIIEKPYCLSSSKKLNFDYHPVELDTICWGKQKPVQAMFWKSMEEFSSQLLNLSLTLTPKVSTKSSPSNTRNYPTQDQRPVSISHKSLGKLKYPIIFRQAYLFLYLDLSGNHWTTHHPDILSCTQSYLCIDLKQLIDI